MDCLKGEFEVEPGEGGSRCEYLKEKGIVTYLVVVPKQPLRNGINGVVSGSGDATASRGARAPHRHPPPSTSQKLSLTSSHGGSPSLVNTKECNGSLSLACTSPEDLEEPDARVRSTLESGEEDGEVEPTQSTSLLAAHPHLAGAYSCPGLVEGASGADAWAVLAQAVNPSFPNPRRRLRLRDLAERVIDASQNEQELNKLLNEALLERESIQA